MNPLLHSILCEGPFKGRTGLYKLFPEEFQVNPSEREMPTILISLVATFVRSFLTALKVSDIRLKAFMGLDAWVNGSESLSWNYNAPVVTKVFNGHMDELREIKAKKSTSYHAIRRKFFERCVYVYFFLLPPVMKLKNDYSANSGNTSRPPKKTKTDYENLPDSFSD